MAWRDKLKISHHNTAICGRGKVSNAFTLVELLIVVSITSLLLATIMPALRKAKQQAQALACMNNVRQLSLAFISYGCDYDYYTMPSAYTNIGTYWWGRKLSDGINHKDGIMWPYLKSDLGKKSVFECPSQPFGSYKLQGVPPGQKDEPKWITSTYGYNGYYLCSPQSGWYGINFRPWLKTTNIPNPSAVIAFADTLANYDMTGGKPILKNNFSFDPPYIFVSNRWQRNATPTTCFRHNDKTNAVFVDGHCQPTSSNGAKYMTPSAKIGSIGNSNSPYYVPDFRQWSQEKRRR
ncbi:MAG: type II secretion system protein [Phycisphaerae bacterium]|nr:type II secretion system protein [Phycisphaerae bacterium]